MQLDMRQPTFSSLEGYSTLSVSAVGRVILLRKGRDDVQITTAMVGLHQK